MTGKELLMKKLQNLKGEEYIYVDYAGKEYEISQSIYDGEYNVREIKSLGDIKWFTTDFQVAEYIYGGNDNE